MTYNVFGGTLNLAVVSVCLVVRCYCWKLLLCLGLREGVGTFKDGNCPTMCSLLLTELAAEKDSSRQA